MKEARELRGRNPHQPRWIKADDDALRRAEYLREKAISASGSAVISAIIVNPLDVAKTRLQSQEAGVSYQPPCAMDPGSGSGSFKVPVDGRCPPACPRAAAAAVAGVSPHCPPPGHRYKNTFDVMRRVVNEVGIYLPCYDLLREELVCYSDENSLEMKPYAPLLAGSLARSVTVVVCSPLELAKTRMQAQKDPKTGKLPGAFDVLRSLNNTYGVGGGPCKARSFVLDADPDIGMVLGANFVAGMFAGGLAAAFTCPLDVIKTWHQIEKDPAKVMSMTLRRTLVEIWQRGGMRALFTGVGPRIARAAPATGIVVSFYEVVKYVVQRM